jgi:hypothetical protein
MLACKPALIRSEQWFDVKFERAPSEIMTEYRAYIVGVDEHFIGFEPIVCASDEEAIASCRRLVEGHDVELWCGVRLVVRLSRGSK